jgi:hypothetical protein
VEVKRRSDLKEEASDLERQDVAAKTTERESERELGTKWKLPLTELEQPTLDDHTSLVFIPPG